MIAERPLETELTEIASLALEVLETERARMGVDEWDESDNRCLLHRRAEDVLAASPGEPEGQPKYEPVGYKDLVAGETVEVYVCIENDVWDWESRQVVAIELDKVVFRDGAREYLIDRSRPAKRMRRKVQPDHGPGEPSDGLEEAWRAGYDKAVDLIRIASLGVPSRTSTRIVLAGIATTLDNVRDLMQVGESNG